jgi:hypothetical protein
MRIAMRERIIDFIGTVVAATLVGICIVLVGVGLQRLYYGPPPAPIQTSAAITVPNDGWRIKLYYKSPEGIEKELDAYIAIPGYIFKIESVTAKDAK